MRRRAIGKILTDRNLNCGCIIDIAQRYTALHAYGVGLDVFRELPEFSRAQAMDYAKYILAFELDDEIDSASAFLEAMHCARFKTKRIYLRCSYLLHLYTYWRLVNPTHMKNVPPGALIVAALLLGERVKVPMKIRPDSLIAMNEARSKYMVEYLAKHFDFVDWSDEKKYLIISDDRKGEEWNEPRSVDAVEEENGK